jgi:hypothetical protein
MPFVDVNAELVNAELVNAAGPAALSLPRSGECAHPWGPDDVWAGVDHGHELVG